MRNPNTDPLGVSANAMQAAHLRAADRIPVERVMNPRTVAVIGASANEAKFGSKLLECLVHQRFDGAIFPINPRSESLRGLKAYPSIAHAPGPVDLAVIAVPASQLLETVRDCANAGVGACLITTAQTAEYDVAGEQLQRDIVSVAHATGMRLVGPNCLGFINPAHRMALTPSGTMLHVSSLEVGNIGLVSQSGALMATLFMIGYDHGVHFSRMLSVGNQADLEVCDFFEALIDDEATGIICLYIEGLVNAARFMELARRAREVGKPVLVVKAGQTDSGQIAAMSHTASFAGSFDAFRAACEATGVLLIDEPEGMILIAGAMDRLGTLPPGKIAIMVSSGGCGAVTSDRLNLRGVPLAKSYGKETHDALTKLYQERHVNNPIDLGVLKKGPNLGESVETVRTLLADADVAGMLFLMTPQPFMPEMAAGLTAAWKESGKPVLVVLDTGSLGESVRQQLVASGTSFVSRIDDGIRALEAMFRYRDTRDSMATPPLRPASLPREHPRLSDGLRTEQEIKRLLANYGIASLEEQIVHDEEEALKVSKAMGHRVVMKALSGGISHNSEAGLVKLTNGSDEEVCKAFKELSNTLRNRFPDRDMEIAVQSMAPDGIELFLKGRNDQQFGPQLLLGFGGDHAELLSDVCIAPVPVSPEKARAMLMSLKLAPLLTGFRGRPVADLDALAHVISRFSWLLADLGNSLEEFELSPLLVQPSGQGVLVVAARAVPIMSSSSTT